LPRSDWYRDAIIYEVHVRSFRDSNGDGIGDLCGLTESLDYLRDLGVSALWLLPFYPSPLRDDGYDISDYIGVHPAYGTVRDFQTFIREAHKRGLRVITELICNHTSDQHPWFERARRSPPGSRWRNFYVWSDTPDRYPDARIIFKDFETSNWTWDHVAGAYYWHRFYSHQPDLNYDSPDVRAAIFRVVDFWLDRGVDGLRLDAVPYLYERDGTDCENLPETHAFLRDLRRHVDEKYGDRMLLAEANQWPEDAAAYFGDGDECHMAFNFPVMPRMFMAIRQEDRRPIVDIVEQTPAIPETSQWALFLRNHDELTLEMVTDEERDYMYKAYAGDIQARVNLGIRRRLAPLLGNHRRRIELMFGLLFSLPGTPVLYYGDEIGMGDNIYLGDRDSVRTPMQWNADRNAGFSSAEHDQLFLPVVTDAEHRYETVNVAVQQANPHSLLWWMKRLIAVRRIPDALPGKPPHPGVRAPARRRDGPGRGQHVALLPAGRPGPRPVPGPPAGRDVRPRGLPGDRAGAVSTEPGTARIPVVHPQSEPRCGPRRRSLPGPTAGGRGGGLPRGQLGRGARGGIACVGTWPALVSRRWPAGADRGDRRPIRGPHRRRSRATRPAADNLRGRRGRHVPRASDDRDHVGHAADNGRWHSRLGRTDATADRALDAALVDVIARSRRIRGQHGILLGRATASARRGLAGGESAEPAAPALALRLRRNLDTSPDHEAEIIRFLSETGVTWVPQIAGRLEYQPIDGPAGSAGFILAGETGATDLSSLAQHSLLDFLEQAAASPMPAPHPSLATGHLLRLALAAEDVEVEMLGPVREIVRSAGRQVGEMHTVLASATDPAFAPEPFTRLYQRSIHQAIDALWTRVARSLDGLPADLRRGVTPDVEALVHRRREIAAALRRLLATKFGGARMRIHGDLEFASFRQTEHGTLVLDLSTAPSRPSGERHRRQPALEDVATMIGSIHDLALGRLDHSGVGAQLRVQDMSAVDAWATQWCAWVSAALLDGYRASVAGAAFVPLADDEWVALLDALRLQRALERLAADLRDGSGRLAASIRALRELTDDW
jgi:maltose alpha-D-glucosyltransferase/alpha-amylase